MAYKTSSKGTTPRKGIKDNTFSGLGSLIKLLPTGTVFVFQFLNPLFTDNGECDSRMNRHLSAALIGLCGLSCFFSSFTDSYVDLDGSVHYGIATRKGLWPSGDDSVDLSKYKLQFQDFVHAVLSFMVFGAVAFLDSNTMECFSPKYEKNEKLTIMLKALPPLIGAMAGTVFMMFPNKRHGIGYPPENDSEDDDHGISS
ncbi:protein DMP2 [Punica granatum]|uniref:Uncharacterized protein n=2 Tax=Punica granatum TaxID=22663 RepID=A0A218WNI0_PUNGR|nr:protein DMP2 [Punica granatum]OWM74173.1 hypothetical protein CDL15_Pgr008485 [Punica granatum]PKI47974.1 hypothetical protein CRG98_031638 [Punica granatum]